jgi:glutamate--cysteine ligase
MNKPLTTNNFSGSLCVPCIQSKQDRIHRWLLSNELRHTPIYTSVDIRDAGFKIAVVDTNLFPAGFNNLCEHGLFDAVALFKKAIHKRVPTAKNVLIAAEEHTRNTWYLENVRILQEIISKAGFNVTVATFFTTEPKFCEQSASAIELETATGATVKINCFKRIIEKIKNKQAQYDIILMNNDLTGGIPDSLRAINIPIFPSIYAGWHARHKSEHFRHTNELMKEFAELAGLDPWQFSCLFEMVEDVDINKPEDQQRLYQSGVKLFSEIQAKYTEHGIDEKPFIFIKSDSGTYGLGVMAIEDPKQLLELNSRKRHDLERAKGGVSVDRFLLQEGVPTIHRIAESPCEVCIYQIDNNVVGGFYRYHTNKGDRESLNSPGGMGFQKLCPHLDKYGQDCGVTHNLNIFDIYRILARIAGIAASREIRELEQSK